MGRRIKDSAGRPAGQGSTTDPFSTLGSRVRRDAWSLAARWLGAALSAHDIGPLRSLPPLDRYASTPAVLVAVGDAIAERVSPEQIDASLSEVARAHGAQRRRLGFSEQQLLQEFLLLRDLLLEDFATRIEDMDISAYDELRRRLDHVFDRLILDAGRGYVETVVEQMEGVAATDPLTGLLNRRGFSAGLEPELARAHRYRRPLSVAYIDVEGLKPINDRHGHEAGDRLLRTVANLISQESRDHDLCGRIGGDEFAVALIEQDQDGADAFSHRIAVRLHDCRTILGHSTRWGLTVGVAVFPEDGDSTDELLAAADRRLYAKRGIEIGRD